MRLLSVLSLNTALAAALLAAAPLAVAQTVTPSVTPTTSTTPATKTEEVTDAGRVGTFKLVQGETWVGRSDTRRSLQPGDGLKETDRVSTGKTGAASIILKDGTVLTMGPNTTMDLSRFQFDTTTQKGNFALELLQGSVRVVTGLLAKINPDLFKVSTPTSVVGVRGTDFIVETTAVQ